MNLVAQSPFYASRSERLALARRRYFEEGESPAGVVSEAVFQSWARCQRLHSRPDGKVVFQPVSSSRTNLALQKNRLLHDAWLQEQPHLQTVLGRSSCAAMLTDPTGVLIGATCVGRAHERLMPVATRLGVNLSEEAVGTTAPGVVARTGQAVSVFGGEHFFDEVQAMHCAASPIRDTRGRLVGVLDISSEAIPFRFDASAVVAVYAGAIENRLLLAQSTEHLVIRFQVTPQLLDSSMAALVGIDGHRQLAWRNLVASRLLGLAPMGDETSALPAEEVLGSHFDELASLPRTGSSALSLPNGLVVWARSEMQATDGRRDMVQPGKAPRTARAISTPDDPDPPAGPALVAPAAQEPVSLRCTEHDLIARAVQECAGNVAQAARRLGVSRGLIYRRMRSTRPPSD